MRELGRELEYGLFDGMRLAGMAILQGNEYPDHAGGEYDRLRFAKVGVLFRNDQEIREDKDEQSAQACPMTC